MKKSADNTKENARRREHVADSKEIARECANRVGVDLDLNRRGALNLERDTSQHRRFSWLYDDLLS